MQAKSVPIPTRTEKKMFPNLAQYLVNTNDDLSTRIQNLQKKLEDALSEEAGKILLRIYKNHNEIKI